MEIKDIKKKLGTLGSDSNFMANPALKKSAIEAYEFNSDQKIPEKIKEFYLEMNGLKLEKPNLEIFKMEDWTIQENKLIQFAKVENQKQLSFDSSSINKSNSWNILDQENNKVSECINTLLKENLKALA
jgi:hypothetical protein